MLAKDLLAAALGAENRCIRAIIHDVLFKLSERAQCSFQVAFEETLELGFVEDLLRHPVGLTFTAAEEVFPSLRAWFTRTYTLIMTSATDDIHITSRATIRSDSNQVTSAAPGRDLSEHFFICPCIAAQYA